MPRVPTCHLSDAEAAALREARESHGTYKEIAYELEFSQRSLEHWLQVRNRGPIPARKLQAFLELLLDKDVTLYDRLRFVLRDRALHELQVAHHKSERQREFLKLAEKAGVSLESLRPPVGPHEAKRRGHIGMVRVSDAR